MRVWSRLEHSTRLFIQIYLAVVCTKLTIKFDSMPKSLSFTFLTLLADLPKKEEHRGWKNFKISDF